MAEKKAKKSDKVKVYGTAKGKLVAGKEYNLHSIAAEKLLKKGYVQKTAPKSEK